MIRLPPFTYVAPRTLDEAVRAMTDAGPDGMLVAGGTDLYPNMKRRQFTPEVLVSLRRAVDRTIGTTASGGAAETFHIGAGATLTQIADHPAVRQGYQALAQAAGLVSTPQLRN
ncbi:MAG: FAD binding domain-containing protein, partial [Thermoanaerobaculia bacterium]